MSELNLLKKKEKTGKITLIPNICVKPDELSESFLSEQMYMLEDVVSKYLFSKIFPIPSIQIGPMNFVYLNPSFFGYNAPIINTRLFNNDFLHVWSRENLNGQILKICLPAHIPYIQYIRKKAVKNNDKHPENSLVAMDSIRYKESYKIFSLGENTLTEVSMGIWDVIDPESLCIFRICENVPVL